MRVRDEFLPTATELFSDRDSFGESEVTQG